MKKRIITNLAVGPGAVQIDYVEREDIRDGGTRACSLQVPTDGPLADRLDRFLMELELLVDHALESFLSTPVAEDEMVDFEDVESFSDGMPEGASPWDNPEERGAACWCANPDLPVFGCPVHDSR